MNDLGLKASQHYQTAVSLHRQNRLGEARRHYAAALQACPGHPLLLQGLGVVQVHLGELEAAIDCFRQAVAAAPRDATLQNYLGLALAQTGRHGEAADAFAVVVELQPEAFEVRMYLALACCKAGRFAAAATAFTAALAQRPDHIPALMGLGDIDNVLGQHEEALRHYERVLALAPQTAGAHFGVGTVLQQLGRFDEARAAFERALALAPQEPAIHRALAEMAPFRDGDPRLAPMLALEAAPLAEPQKVELHFALAKAFDDLKQYEAAFAHLAKGNAIRRRLVHYEEAEVMGFFGEVKTAFPEALLRSAQGCSSQLPVFVIGMPRSGSSLVEQILASHPQVFGAGELTVIQDLIDDGAADKYASFGERYVARVQTLAPAADRIIDKLPANFRHAGLIHMALPKARLIHLRRDAMDTCFSCYSKLFLNGLNYTCDLGELGRYYKAYEELMVHWRSALPADVLLEVDYEKLVSNLEEEARRIVAFCGLAWDDRCLRFYETARPVRTLSGMQVRQKLFATSIGRWRPYAAWLGPLREALG